MTRAGEGLVDVQLGDFCRVRARRGAGDAEREAVVLYEPAQRRRMEMPAFTGEAIVSGKCSSMPATVEA